MKDMTIINGSASALDSSRQACLAIAQAEKATSVRDLNQDEHEGL
jgi:hypothetical protein